MGQISEHQPRKPVNIVYGLDEAPPPLVTAGNAVQHVALISINLVYPLLVFRLADVPVSGVASLIAVGLMVLGAGTFLQVVKLGPVGSGFLCPATFTAAYLSPSLLAVKAGGLPLLFGMTLIAGMLEALFSRLLDRMRPYFPTEISGLVIFMIGISAGLAGLRSVLGANAEPVTPAEWWVAGITLASMVAFNVWGRGMVRMLCALEGLAVGYVAAGLAGLLGGGQFESVERVPWIALPSFHYVGWSFDLALAVPFAVACLAVAMKAVGTITVCQRMVDADWVRPDMRSATRGVLADGVSTMLAGVAGAVGTNTSTPSVGLASATGVASRYVAYAIGGLFIALGLTPKLATLLAVMPRAVMVAALLFTICFIVINGLQVISSRVLDARRTLVIGSAIVAGVAIEVFPVIAAGAPPGIVPLIGSSLVFSTLVALLLNLLFRIGVKQTATLKVESAPVQAEKLEQFIETNGATWGARRDIIARAKFNLAQSIEVIVDSCEPQGPVEVAATFDEFSLDVRVSYIGPPLELPDKRPTNEEIMASEDGQRRLAGFMLRRHADRVRSTHNAGRSTILFHFDH
ncbi:MAG: solute carrier family 23 protein [Burkholderiales bacterium]